MANIKVSEMTEASTFEDGDYTMIVQSNQNKKISHENMLGNVETDVSTIKTNIGNLTSLQTTVTTDIVNAINSMVPTILWTNSNPTSSFAAQTITLLSDDYDMYEVLFIPNVTGDDTQRLNSSGKIPKGYGTRLSINFAGSVNSGANVFSRIVTYNSDTQLDFAVGYVAYGTTARTENNALIVPLYIIGYKTGLFS